MKAAVAVSLARAVQVLVQTRHEESKELTSIMDWEPPEGFAGSGVWKVLKELSGGLSGIGEHMPELRSIEPLPPAELAIRLCYLYEHRMRNPVVDELEVKEDLIQRLLYFLYLAEQAYDAATEPNLKKLLSDKGYNLNFAKMNATWGEHQPAYYVATHTERRELLVAVRGTWEVEDVVTDITADPQEFGEEGHLVHGGMLRSAQYLFDRLQGLVEALQEGWRVMLVGHSLGAGAASLLALMLESNGLPRERLSCLAFAPPMAMAPELADACKGLVTSIVFRDDIVTRVSQETMVGLYDELEDLDWRKASQDEEVHEQLRRFTGIMHKLHGWVGGVVSTGDNGHQEGAKQGSADEEAQPADGASEGQLSKTGSAESAISAQAEKGYNPIVPGQVVYIFR
eukprot:jgi/Astpho2/4980/fgenesh1_pg.00070_%23_33_t